MGKRYYAKRISCPYYKGEQSQVIYCTSPVEGTVIHVAFYDRGKKWAYREKCCKRCGDGCPVAEMQKAG